MGAPSPSSPFLTMRHPLKSVAVSAQAIIFSPYEGWNALATRIDALRDPAQQQKGKQDYVRGSIHLGLASTKRFSSDKTVLTRLTAKMDALRDPPTNTHRESGRGRMCINIGLTSTKRLKYIIWLQIGRAALHFVSFHKTV